MQQPVLWADEPPVRMLGPDPAYALARPCPGCGAKAGTYRPAERWRWLLGTSRLCDECARDREVMEVHLRDEPPPDPEWCDAPPGSDAKIERLAARVAAGLAIFQVWDNTWDPAPRKVLTGAPDYQHEPGDTGVEKCGVKWRARPFWRGRKWPLGVFDSEEDAISRSRAFRSIHAGDDRRSPVLWLPCSDEDGAIAVEKEHLESWRADYPGAEARSIASKYQRELKRLRSKPTLSCVWRELKRRLAAAAGPLLFGELPDGADESAEHLES